MRGKHSIDPIGQGAKIVSKIVAWDSMDQAQLAATHLDSRVTKAPFLQGTIQQYMQ